MFVNLPWVGRAGAKERREVVVGAEKVREAGRDCELRDIDGALIERAEPAERAPLWAMAAGEAMSAADRSKTVVEKSRVILHLPDSL